MKQDSFKTVGDTHKGGKPRGVPHYVTPTANAPWKTKKKEKQKAAKNGKWGKISKS